MWLAVCVVLLLVALVVAVLERQALERRLGGLWTLDPAFADEAGLADGALYVDRAGGRVFAAAQDADGGKRGAPAADVRRDGLAGQLASAAAHLALGSPYHAGTVRYADPGDADQAAGGVLPDGAELTLAGDADTLAASSGGTVVLIANKDPFLSRQAGAAGATPADATPAGATIAGDRGADAVAGH
jgi:hypothetical protein